MDLGKTTKIVLAVGVAIATGIWGSIGVDEKNRRKERHAQAQRRRKKLHELKCKKMALEIKALQKELGSNWRKPA